MVKQGIPQSFAIQIGMVQKVAKIAKIGTVVAFVANSPAPSSHRSLIFVFNTFTSFNQDISPYIPYILVSYLL